MSAYRLGAITVHDDEAGTLVLEGDGFAAAGELGTLITNPAVAHFVGMSEREEEQLQAADATYRETLRALYSGAEWTPPSVDPRTASARGRLRAAVDEVLGAERAAAVHRLSWRIRDGLALTDDDVAATLQLTAAQRAEVAEAARRSDEDNQAVLRSTSRGRLATHQPIEDAGRDRTQSASDRLRAILTPQQREQFDRMKHGAR